MRKQVIVDFDLKGAKKAEAEMHGFGNALASTSRMLGPIGIGLSVGALGLAKFGWSAKNTAKEFESLRVRLDSMYGSTVRGGLAFQKFNDLAAKTPYALKDVVEAGASLKAFGLDAEAQLPIVADLAAFMGKDLTDAASAVGRAFAGGIGAADILRETGIIQKILTHTGKTVADFAGPEGLGAFREALFDTLTDPRSGIAGATAKLAQTTEGLESNLGDAYARMMNEVGKKFAPQYKAALQTAINITNAFTNVFTDFEGNTIESAINVRKAMQEITNIKELDLVADQLDVLGNNMLKSGAWGSVQTLARGFSFLSEEQRKNIEAASDMNELYKVLAATSWELRDAVKAGNKELEEFDMNLDAIDLSTGKVIKNHKEYNKEWEDFLVKAREATAATEKENEHKERYNKLLIAEAGLLKQVQTIQSEGSGGTEGIYRKIDALIAWEAANDKITEKELGHIEMVKVKTNDASDDYIAARAKQIDAAWSMETAAQDMGMAIMDLGVNFEASSKAYGRTVMNTARGVISSNIAEGVSSVLAGTFESYPPPLSLIMAPLLAAGASALFNTLIPAFATGADFETRGPMIVKVGDNPGGRERVQVTPIGSPNLNGPKNNEGGITIVFNGPVTSEAFVDTEVIPKIKKAIRRGAF